ncbi:hypothetical protein PIB30_113178, partial [Stylosanthes scabra]|nr:hypothetical protein [Stylosanthes scabra]
APSHRIPISTETQVVCHILQGDGALTPRHVKRMGLWTPALHKCRQERRIKDEILQLDRMPKPGLLQERRVKAK